MGGAKFALILIALSALAIAINYTSPNFYHHICNVYCSSVIYFGGMYIGEKIYKKKSISMVFVWLPILLHIIQYVIFRVFHNPIMEIIHNPIRDLTYVLLASSLVWLLSVFFSKILKGSVKLVVEKLGSISLESYLFNTYFGYIIQYLIINNVLHYDLKVFCIYFISCILGLYLSTPYQKFINKIPHA